MRQLVEVAPGIFRTARDGETPTHRRGADGELRYHEPAWPVGAIVINQAALGLGDAVSGAFAVNGFRLREEAAKTGKPIVYKVTPVAVPFIRQLDLGGVQIGRHDFGNCEEHRPKGAAPGDIQLNPAYSEEMTSGWTFTRFARNARNLGGVDSVRPGLRGRAGLAAQGLDAAGVVVLAPFCAWPNREWPVHHWLELERRLREHGYRVLVLDWQTRDNRTDRMHSEKLIGAAAERVFGVLLNAACVVANDTGTAHLAAIAGAPSLILCGEVPGRAIWPPYGEHVRWIDAIGNMAAIAVDDVLQGVIEIAGPPRRPPGAIGETIKAHGRRQREGWYPQYCAAPLLDVGCWVDYLQPGFPCRRFDRMYGDGDATEMVGVPDGSYATVYASHVLEHVHDPVAALRSWWRILRPGGTLIVCVPHRDLYEGTTDLPSRWNGDHKTFWLPDAPGPGDPPHTRGLRQVLDEALPDGEVISFRVLDDGHSYPDKTVHPIGEFSIEAIIRKPATR